MKKNNLLVLALIIWSKLLFAQQPYVGEIRMFAGNFAPAGWVTCDGSLLSISEYETLFNLIGITYGGDGQSTFALPDLRSRVPVGTGQGSGLSNRQLGELGGQESVTFTNANLPAHTHAAQLKVSNQNATLSVPTNTSTIAVSSIKSGRSTIASKSFNSAVPDILLGNVTTASVGGNQPIDIIKPYCGMKYIISLFGIYPNPN